MRVSNLSALACAAVLGTIIHVAPAQAQATRTWVSGVGDDVNPCSRTAPCKTFAGAISKTAVNGEINCLDPGGFGTLTITKSITVDCLYIPGAILNAGLAAITVNFNSFAGTDLRKAVRIRGINMQGANTGTAGVRILGGTVTGGVVSIEESVIDGNFGGGARGITDERTGAGELYVTNTIIRNNGNTGIVVAPVSGTSAVHASITGVESNNNGNNGIFVGNGAQATILDSVFSGNTNNGIDVEAGGDATILRSVSSKNGSNGLFTSAGTARVADSTLAYSAMQANGAWTSFGNNRVIGNAGTAPTAAGPASTDLGQK